MKTIYKKRLLKLAKHLRSGKLGHKKFDFSKINAVIDKKTGYKVELDHNGCGTLGCAIGECPTAFPNQWKFRDGRPVVNRFRVHYDESFGSAELFFGLTERESGHLFVPCYQSALFGRGEPLYGDASRKQVAAHIEAFVRFKSKKEPANSPPSPPQISPANEP